MNKIGWQTREDRDTDRRRLNQRREEEEEEEEVHRCLSRNRLVKSFCTVSRKLGLSVFNLVTPRSLSFPIVPREWVLVEIGGTSERAWLRAHSTSYFLANESRCSEIDLTVNLRRTANVP